MNLILDGEVVDIFDEAAMQAAIERRTGRVLSQLDEENASVREEQLLNTVTFIALKAGALAAYHSLRRDEPVNLDHLVEVAQQLQAAVGLTFVQPEPEPANEPRIILPPGAELLEGDDDSGTQEG